MPQNKKTRILRSFNDKDFRFFGKSNKEVHHPLENKSDVFTVRIRWIIQKNSMNGFKYLKESALFKFMADLSFI